MTVDDVASRTLDIYLRKVRHGLRGLPGDEAKEIVDELRSHALDRAGGALTAASVDATISGLGSARELAGLYLAERMAERVEVSRSPWLVLKTMWRLASLSVRAFFTFTVLLIGYLFGGTLIFVAILKLFQPKQIGLWMWPVHGQWDFVLGSTDSPHSRDLLGWWLVPLCLIVGGFCVWLTGRFGLHAMRKLGRASGDILRKTDR
jgi:hypothetical protein